MLDAIARHAGLEDAKPYTEKMVGTTTGYVGHKGVDEEMARIVPEMRELFEKPTEELERLINMHWPNLQFTGLEEEV